MTSYMEDMQNLTEAMDKALDNLPKNLSERLKLVIIRAILDTVFPRYKETPSVSNFMDNLSRQKSKLSHSERRMLSNLMRRVLDEVIITEFLLF